MMASFVPRSTNTRLIPVNTVAMATNPKSPGFNNLAINNVTKNDGMGGAFGVYDENGNYLTGWTLTDGQPAAGPAINGMDSGKIAMD